MEKWSYKTSKCFGALMLQPCVKNRYLFSYVASFCGLIVLHGVNEPKAYCRKTRRRADTFSCARSTCQRREPWVWTRRLPPRWAEWTGSICIRRGRTATGPPGNGWHPLERRSPGAAGPPEPDWTGTSWAPSAWTSPTGTFSLELRFPPDLRWWWVRTRQRFRFPGARCCTGAGSLWGPKAPWRHLEIRPCCPLGL